MTDRSVEWRRDPAEPGSTEEERPAPAPGRRPSRPERDDAPGHGIPDDADDESPDHAIPDD
jgi:hypothetical protein